MEPIFYISTISAAEVDIVLPQEPSKYNDFLGKKGHVNVNANIELVGSGDFTEYVNENGSINPSLICMGILEGKIKLISPR